MSHGPGRRRLCHIADYTRMNAAAVNPTGSGRLTGARQQWPHPHRFGSRQSGSGDLKAARERCPLIPGVAVQDDGLIPWIEEGSISVSAIEKGLTRKKLCSIVHRTT